MTALISNSVPAFSRRSALKLLYSLRSDKIELGHRITALETKILDHCEYDDVSLSTLKTRLENYKSMHAYLRTRIMLLEMSLFSSHIFVPRPQDSGRVHNVELAHELAILWNQILWAQNELVGLQLERESWEGAVDIRALSHNRVWTRRFNLMIDAHLDHIESLFI